jgi:transglutaminase-like putative cysteine protease
MQFDITHITHYTYGHPAAEAYGEARLTPPDSPTQRVVSHEIAIDPDTRTSSYIDFLGNKVHFFSLPYRHKKLTITNRAVVRTKMQELPAHALETTIGETKQIFSSSLTDIFEYLQPTDRVEVGQQSISWVKRFLRGDRPLGKGLESLCEAIHDEFEYKSGSTDNSTPLSTVWKEKRGVCQDFAHIGLSIMRTAGLPCRYVCGYIEATAPPDKSDNRPSRALTGAMATHAWIEALVPGRTWIGFDPTNRKWVDERYVVVSYGRDFRDATPLRGTFKGSGGQTMKVKVFMKRKEKRP